MIWFLTTESEATEWGKAFKQFAQEKMDPVSLGTGGNPRVSLLHNLWFLWRPEDFVFRLGLNLAGVRGREAQYDFVKEVGGAGAKGLGHGGVMTANTLLNVVTLGNSPLQERVDQLIAENGLTYSVANIAGNIGVEAGITALSLGTSQILRAGRAGVYGARTLWAARALQPVLAVREAIQTGQSVGHAYSALQKGDIGGAALNLGFAGLGGLGAFTSGRQTAMILRQVQAERSVARLFGSKGMFNSAEGGLRATELASAELLAKVQSKGRTINYALSGSDDLRYLNYMRANANVGGEKMTHILLHLDPRKVEVLEEFLHGTQKRIGLIDRIGVDAAESHVKDFMIRHYKLLGISREDVEILKKMLGE